MSESAKRRRQNAVTPLDRIFVRREDAADLCSVSPSLFDQLVNEGTLPAAHHHFHSLPMWHVATLLVAAGKLINETRDQGDDAWPEPEL
jgi:hypothetical protein